MCNAFPYVFPYVFVQCISLQATFICLRTALCSPLLKDQSLCCILVAGSLRALAAAAATVTEFVIHGLTSSIGLCAPTQIHARTHLGGMCQGILDPLVVALRHAMKRVSARN